MHSLSTHAWFWFGLIGILAFGSVLPTLIALFRGVHDLGFIIMINVLGVAIVFGWPIALITALVWPRREPAVRHIPYPSQHGGAPGRPWSP